MVTRVRWVGGGNVPSSMFGRVAATWPFAVLTLETGRARLDIRPRLFGAVCLDGAPADMARVFPARTTMSRGVGFRPHTGDSWLFWSRSAPDVLDACRLAGFPVTDEVENVTKLVWTLSS